ncbi:hypothetical protein SASPL_132428 [Salvia splendens]|nr:hypothetical protein SASPL_132428 [Salvia splendens]
MAVADGQCDDDEGAAALFKEEGVDYADDIDHSDTPILLRPLASATESGNLDALRQAVDAFDHYWYGRGYASSPCCWRLWSDAQKEVENCNGVFWGNAC